MLRRSIVFLTCVLIGCGGQPSSEVPKGDAGVGGAPDVPPPDPGLLEDTPITPRYQALADAIEKERKAKGAPGVAALVIEKGEVTFARGFGSKSPDADDPAHATTLFRVGSITKMLTATAVLQQVAKKKIGLDDKVKDLIPGFSIGGEPGVDVLTLRQLLTHTSGINDLTPLYGTGSQKDDAWLAAYTTGGFESDGYFMSPPGRMFNYANPDYALAGLIAERASGTIYRTTMQDGVFTPLGMKRTFFLGTDVEADGDFATANTINLETGNPEKAGPTSYDEAWSRPAGYAWSSVRDLAMFAQFLLEGKPEVLADDMRQQMTSAQVSTKDLGDHYHYGMGLYVLDAALIGSSLYPLHVVSHTGSIPGYSGALQILPEQGFAFITLSNADDVYFEDSYAVALQTLTDMPAPISLNDVAPDPTKVGDYAGTFVDPWSFGTMTVTSANGKLTLVMPDIDAAGYTYTKELSPLTLDNFALYIEGSGIQLTFIRDDAGNVEYVRSRLFVSKKATSQSAKQAPPHAIASLPSLLRAARREGPRTLASLPAKAPQTSPSR